MKHLSISLGALEKKIKTLRVDHSGRFSKVRNNPPNPHAFNKKKPARVVFLCFILAVLKNWNISKHTHNHGSVENGGLEDEFNTPLGSPFSTEAHPGKEYPNTPWQASVSKTWKQIPGTTGWFGRCPKNGRHLSRRHLCHGQLPKVVWWMWPIYMICEVKVWGQHIFNKEYINHP